MYLLHYAETPDLMNRMCRNIAANLTPGGHLVALLPEPDHVVGKEDTTRYGFEIHTVKTGDQWILVRVDIHTTPPFSIEYRQWARQSYEEALHAAGFQYLQWHPFEVSREGLARFGAAYWWPAVENPLSVALTAVCAKE